VPSRIVQNEVDFPLSGLKKITDKVAKGLCAESWGFSGQQSSRFEVECPEEAHFVADGGREHTGLLSPGRPHPYQAAVPLEMDFVLAPKLDVGGFHPLVVVFLKASCISELASLGWRRGLWRLNPSLWNSLWHCRTLSKVEYSSARWCDNKTPSQRFWLYPKSLGERWSSFRNFCKSAVDRRAGRPVRLPSHNPVSPSERRR
jgi:hypothetical protein